VRERDGVVEVEVEADAVVLALVVNELDTQEDKRRSGPLTKVSESELMVEMLNSLSRCFDCYDAPPIPNVQSRRQQQLQSPTHPSLSAHRLRPSVESSRI
jgi:hypothetical protein